MKVEQQKVSHMNNGEKKKIYKNKNLFMSQESQNEKKRNVGIKTYLKEM